MPVFVRQCVVITLCLAASIWLGPSPVSAQGLDIEEGRAHFEARRFEEAFRIIEPLANEGNGEAQYILGIAYENGYGPKLHHAPRALHWYLKAAKSGHTCARRRLIESMLFQGYVQNELWGDYQFKFRHLMDGPTNKTYSALVRWERLHLEDYHKKTKSEKQDDKANSEFRRGRIVMRTWYRIASEKGLLPIEIAIFKLFYSFKYNEILVSEKLSEIALSGEFWRWLEELRANWPARCGY